MSNGCGYTPRKNASKALLALAISSITATAYAESASQDFVPTTLAGASAQSEAKGFIDGQSLGGTTRNWYSNEMKFRGQKFGYYKNEADKANEDPKSPSSSSSVWITRGLRLAANELIVSSLGTR